MKKRVAIYVDVKDWKSVRIRAVELGMSAGGYLIGLHLRDDSKPKGKRVPDVTEQPKKNIVSDVGNQGYVVGFSKDRQLGRREKK